MDGWDIKYCTKCSSKLVSVGGRYHPVTGARMVTIQCPRYIEWTEDNKDWEAHDSYPVRFRRNSEGVVEARWTAFESEWDD